MHEGQKQFFDYILSRVAAGKRKGAEQLLHDAFGSQSQNTFGADALSAFHKSILALVKPEYVDEVNGILTRHGESIPTPDVPPPGKELDMKSVILYIAMSLDGYIADEAGGVGWLSGDGSQSDHPGSYPSFYETVDTIILGYRTYRQIVTELSPDRWFYTGKTSYVVTHRQEPSADEIIFTDGDLAALIRRLKLQEGKNIWICGGADIVDQLAAADLIDRYHITVIPTILGGGVRLFQSRGAAKPLRLISSECYNGMVDLIYESR